MEARLTGATEQLFQKIDQRALRSAPRSVKRVLRLGILSIAERLQQSQARPLPGASTSLQGTQEHGYASSYGFTSAALIRKLPASHLVGHGLTPDGTVHGLRWLPCGTFAPRYTAFAHRPEATHVRQSLTDRDVVRVGYAERHSGPDSLHRDARGKECRERTHAAERDERSVVPAPCNIDVAASDQERAAQTHQRDDGRPPHFVNAPLPPSSQFADPISVSSAKRRDSEKANNRKDIREVHNSRSLRRPFNPPANRSAPL